MGRAATRRAKLSRDPSESPPLDDGIAADMGSGYDGAGSGSPGEHRAGTLAGGEVCAAVVFWGSDPHPGPDPCGAGNG